MPRKPEATRITRALLHAPGTTINKKTGLDETVGRDRGTCPAELTDRLQPLVAETALEWLESKRIEPELADLSQ